MARLAFALPCVPGGGDKLRELAKQCRGPRRAEFEDFHRRVGLTSEAWYLQQSAQGEVFILILEGDVMGSLEKAADSEHPFDKWFKEQARQVHGVDFNQKLPTTPPEEIFEG
jgi:hypothetical protein